MMLICFYDILNTMKKYLCVIFLILCTLFCFTKPRMGANRAEPFVAEYFKKLPLESNQTYILTQQDSLNLVSLGENLGINVFELLDCVYRFSQKYNNRIVLLGNDLQFAKKSFNLGGDRVEALLPIDKLIRIECGATFDKNQRALDIYLIDSYQDYIEIGTAVYEKRFGFAQLEPNLFSKPYGIQVKRMIFTSNLDKIVMYEPAKAAIYVKGIIKPKRWVLDIIKRK